MKKEYIINFLFVIGIVLVGLLSSFLFRAPKAQPANDPAIEFSSYRALGHVKQIAQKPHSMGTEEHNRVRGYIQDELQKLGLETTVQTTTTICDEKYVRAGYVQNVIGILKGSDSQKAVLVVGHYDSQPNTLGAADDGSAVASMLETARALKQLPQLKNDVIFLFTDGEEAQLFGAKAFTEESGLIDKIGIVLNIEARGSSGPSITYEVSPQNGWIMREYAKAVKYPIAPSIAYEIYKMLPNDSDFTIFRKAGLSGFNVGFIDKFVNYHSMTDSPENLSLNSLQHQGEYIMDITNHFGNIDLSNTKAKDVVYFNWIGYSLILFPIGLNGIFVIMISLLMIFVTYLGLKKGNLTILKILAGGSVFVFSIIITLALAWLLAKGIKLVYPHYSNYYSSNFYNITTYFIVFGFFTITTFYLIYALALRYFSVLNLLLGTILVNYLVMFALLIYIPSGAYLCIVPLILLLIGLAICYVLNLSFERGQILYLLVNFVVLIPIITLFVPLVRMMNVTFGLDTIIAGVAVLTILLGYLLIPLKILFDTRKWILPIVTAFFFFGFLIQGHITSKYTKEQPLQSNVSYYYNSDSKEAFWVSTRTRTDEWNSQFFKTSKVGLLTDFYPETTRQMLKSTAPIVEIPIPELTLLYDSICTNQRKLNFCIKSQQKAQNCLIFIRRNTTLSYIAIDGKKIVSKDFYHDTTSTYFTIAYYAIQEKGINIDFKCRPNDKIDIIVVEKKLGLTSMDGISPIPDNIIPDKGNDSNLMVVKHSWNL